MTRPTRPSGRCAARDDLLLRAHERVGATPPGEAGALLARAAEAQAHAVQEHHDQHFEAAVRLTLSARAYAFRAVRIAGRVR